MKEVISKDTMYSLEDLHISEEQIGSVTTLLQEWLLMKAEGAKRIYSVGKMSLEKLLCRLS